MTIWRPAPRHQRSCPRPGDFTRPGELFALCSIRSLTRPPPARIRPSHTGPVLGPVPLRAPTCPFVRITQRASRAGPRDLGQPVRPAHAPLGRASHLSESRIAHPTPGRVTSASLPGQPMPPSGGASHLSESRIAHSAPGRAPPANLPDQPMPPLGRHRPICPNRAIRASKTRIGAVAFAAAPIPKSQTNPSGRNAAPPCPGSAACGSVLTPAARRRRAARG